MSDSPHETSKNDAKRACTSRTRRFFASELPWFIIAVYCAWTFIVEPVLSAAQYATLPAISVRNNTDDSVFAVATAPKVHRTESTTIDSGEVWGIRFSRDGEYLRTGPVVISVYATDGSLLERWEELAENLAPMRPDPRELVVLQPAHEDAEVTP